MTTTAVKSPPLWTSEMTYEDYKKEIEVWKLLKSASNKEEGPLIYRVLTGEAKAAAKKLTVEQIGSENGLQLIIDKLDELYLADKNQRICSALEAFEKFKRPGSMNMSTFLVEFEGLHSTVQNFQCAYPDGVLAYKVLQAANLSQEHVKLCKATIATGAWSYKAMKDQIKKIFSDAIADKPDLPTNAIKVEPTLFANNYNKSLVPKREASNEGFEGDQEEILYDEENFQPYTDYDKYPYYTGEEYDIYYGMQRGGNYKPYGRKPPFQPSKFMRNSNSSQARGRRYINVNMNRLKDAYDSAPHVPNPKDDRGNATTCRKCRSIYHWMQDCPHITSQENSSSKSKVYYGSSDATDDIYISLFQTSHRASSDEILCLVGETLNMAVIDSGCPITVCGDKWYSTYLESMSQEEKSKIKSEETKAVFRFGDSAPLTSIKKVYLPIKLKEKPMYLPTEIVQADVPLLLSKETLDKGKAVADYGNKTIKLFNVEQPMICTTSGHYAIPIKSHDEQLNSNIVMHVINDDANIKSVAKKLHQQFAHPASHRLTKLVKDAGEDNKELFTAIEEVEKGCDTCKRYRKTSPRPVVTFPLATIFNETVGMDLKIYQNNSIYFLHIVDHATRFSAAGVIRSKKADVIIKKLFQIWIAIFGCPKTIISDNGGEFVNKEFMDMCHNFNIKFITTAAEAPWSNGLVEKHNHLIGDAVYKITEDVKCSIEIALCWAVNAKNSLQNINGFSPYQLVFGRNPNLPSVLFDKLPALEGVSESQLIADQLNALHKARLETIQMEASEKLRRALRAKVRTHNDIRYIQGEEVFYKQDDCKRWKGPGKVIGQDGSKVLIKVPTGLISVHSSRVILTSAAEQERKDKELADEMVEPPKDYDETPDTMTSTTEHPPNENTELDLENIGQEEYERIEENDNHAVDPNMNPDIEVRPPVINPDPQTNEHYPTNHNNVIETQKDDGIKTGNILPKMNQCVDFKTDNSDDWKRCLISSRAGKASGKYKNWLNIVNLPDNTSECIDWESQVVEWKAVDNNVLLASTKKDQGYENAKKLELEKWVEMGVYDVVEDTGQHYVTVKWVLSEKIVEGEKKKKARLVARGYEDDLNGAATDSPTINKESLRIVW